MISSFFGIAGVFDLGVSQAALRLVATYKNLQKNEFISLLFIIQSLLSILFGFIILLFTVKILGFNELLLKTGLTVQQYYLFCTLTFITFFLKNIFMLLKNIFDGLELFSVNNFITVSLYILQIPLLLLSISFRSNQTLLIDFSFIIIISFLVINILGIILLRKKGSIKFHIPNYIFTKQIIKKHFSFTTKIQMMTLIGTIWEPILKWAISAFSNLSLITSFEIAKRITDLIWGVIISVFRPVTPTASKAQNENNLKNYFGGFFNEFQEIANKMVLIFLVFPLLVYYVLLILWFNDFLSLFIFSMLLINLLWQTYSLLSYSTFFSFGKMNTLLLCQLNNLALFSIVPIFLFYFEVELYTFICFPVAGIINYQILNQYLKKHYQVNLNVYMNITLFSIALILSSLVFIQTSNLYFLFLFVTIIPFVIPFSAIRSTFSKNTLIQLTKIYGK